MDYHIGRVYEEAAMVVERHNRELATVGVLIQSATATTGMAAGRKSQAHFSKLIKGLAGESG